MTWCLRQRAFLIIAPIPFGLFFSLGLRVWSPPSRLCSAVRFIHSLLLRCDPINVPFVVVICFFLSLSIEAIAIAIAIAMHRRIPTIRAAAAPIQYNDRTTLHHHPSQPQQQQQLVAHGSATFSALLCSAESELLIN